MAWLRVAPAISALRIGATSYTTGMEHSPTSATGSAWERTPWRAVQSAARGALTKGASRT
jgi:hypothetical protein